jgi:chromosome partitioning protein
MVLVVDLDPQGNASTGLGIRHEEREVTVYDVLAAEAPIEGAIVPTPVDNLFAIPSTIDLAGAEIELVSQFSRELRLRRALEPLRDAEYEFVLLDCPPSLGLLTVNALAAADELIVPIQCEYYALEGLGQLLRNVRLVQQNVNPQLRLTGIVMTMFDPRTKLSEQVVEEVRRYFGERVYRTIIPRTVRLSEAPGFGQPITVYDPRSRGAQSYRELALEVAAKLPEEGPLPVIEELPAVILPAPEPQPVRAPRPLVREDLDDTVDLTEHDLPVEADGAQAADHPADARQEMEVSLDARGTDVPPAGSAGPGAEEDVEADLERSGGPDVDDEPHRRLEVELTDETATPEIEPTVEMTPADEPPQATEPTVEIAPPQAQEAPEERVEPEAPRRRWSLFRRGGSR